MSGINTKAESPWYIFILGGDRLYVIGRTGQYETELEKAMSFTEKIDAIAYVERYGYDRITTIRKVKVS